jgi:hypothetical protein
LIAPSVFSGLSSRIDNPEKTEGAIKRKQKGQSRIDNPEKTEGAIKNRQSREN